MKLKFVFCLTLALLAISCSETTVITGEENGGGGDDPIVEGKFTRRVLIEDFTGTWCGNCTRVLQGIQSVQAQTDKAVVVGIHYGSNEVGNNFYDPYNFDGVEPLRALIYPESPDFPLPVVRLNRLIQWAIPEYLNTQNVLNLTGNDAGLGLAISSSLNGSNLALEVKTKFAEDFSNVKLVVYLLEDNLFFEQENYTPGFMGGVHPLPNFEHDHVLRASLTNILGDVITGETTSGKTNIRTFNITVPDNIANPENMNFVAFVVGSDNKVINSRAAYLNENQLFEQNP